MDDHNAWLADADEGVDRFAATLAAVAGKGVCRRSSVPIAVVERLLAVLTRIEQKLEALQAELLPPQRNPKCPCCQRLSLTVSETRPHPEFGDHGIEQHEIRCGSCGYTGFRLYDPRDFLR